jgi:hypothetical protein
MEQPEPPHPPCLEELNPHGCGCGKAAALIRADEFVDGSNFWRAGCI